MINIFKAKKTETVNFILKNDECKKAIDDLIKNELPRISGILIIYEENQEYYFKHAGIEPAQAIIATDQLHHRIQHEGLRNYD